jgi:copper chaperone CopZ
VLVRDSIEWRLLAPVDAAAAKAAEKAIAKIPGVKKARIDVASRTLTAEIEHDGLRGSTPAPGKDSPPERVLAAAGFLVDDVVDALEAAKLALAEAGAAPRGDGKH